jgi:hypothetical protein
VYRSTLELHKNHQDSLEQMRKTAFQSVLENSDWRNILEAHYIPWLTETPVNPIVAVLPT